MPAQALFRTNLTLPQIMTATQIPAELQTELCASDRPLALLPVRLETRFFLQADSSYELRVRVYPDKIHIDSHETELTASEQEWGKHYWEQNWRAGNKEDAKSAAWRQLAERFDANRAAWIARALQPTNPQDRPASSVSADEPLPKPITFPDLAAPPDASNDFSWRRAPLARLMPDRWIAVAYSGGTVAATATGKDIKQPLAVGPDPQKDPPAKGGDELTIDEGMRWMVDFDEAEDAGMGLRLNVSSQLASSGIDTLLVLGVAKSISADDAADQLGKLLDAHHYTDGLAFLKPGTPTNNTESERSGYSAYDFGQQASFDAEMTSADSVADADSNARQWSVALGLATDRILDVLGRVTFAADRHSLNLRSMNTALWSPTWGYFLTNMIGLEGTGLTADIIAWAREHFIDHVRSVGPYAAIRCARQPYGMLPVTSLDFWEAPPNDASPQTSDAWLRNMLMNLRDKVWRMQLSAVPRVGRTTDAANDLAEVMRSEAESSNYAARGLLSNHYLLHLRAFMGEDLERRGWVAAQDAMTTPILQNLGMDWRPRVTRATYEDNAWGFIAPLVQAGEISAKRALEPNYITALLAEPTIQAILEGHVQVLDGGTLLHALLRHAALLEHANAATAILSSQGETLNGQDTSYANLIKDHELVNLMPASQPTMTWKRQLDQVVPAITGIQTIRAYLESLTQFQSSSVAALGEFKKSLAHLQQLDSESLQYLTQGVLDLASHRLDAWITSLATKRLSMMRVAKPQGLYVGGYAWVENLRPATALAAAALPSDEPAPLFAQPNDTGFIHAPSLSHASTAALLRNAHLEHNGVASADSPFAIDLSSRRMRESEQILDGVRQGQPLGALLGYRFERRLHEMSKDQFIDDFRAIAPLVADRLAAQDQPQENIAANNVVDGLALNQKWPSLDEKGPSQKSKLEMLTGPDYEAIKRELIALGETIDALADALTAETAYQIVRGNNSRLASTLQAVATGDAPPPELDVARTPRSGIALTHRVVTLFNATATSTTGWAAASTSPPATAEPVLNAWAAGLLGDPRKARCIVEQLDDSSDTVVKAHEVKLSELALTPLDVVFGVDAQPRSGSLTELEQRVLMYVRRKVAAITETTRLRLAQSRPSDWTAKDLLLQDVVDQARSARCVLARSRALDGRDLDLPERNAVSGVDLKELSDRVTDAETALTAAQSALQTQIAKGSDSDAESLRTAVLETSAFGVLGAVPLSQKGDNAAQRSLLLTQAGALTKDIQGRLDKGMDLRAQPEGDTDLKKCDQLLNRMRAVFGQDFIAMPRFRCDNATELKSTKAATVELQGGDDLAACSWFARCERVRDPLAALGIALRGAEVLNTGERLNLSVAQLPFVTHDRWAALPIPEGQTLGAGRLSLVIQSADSVDATESLAGLLIDEWVEVIPNRTETTAISFQYNPPDVCAPQSILLAVPPVPDKAWTGWDLQRVLMETLDLAKLRAVDPPALNQVSQFLPALYFGFNADDAAVSTNFAPMTR